MAARCLEIHPRALWSRWCEPDDAHRIRLACRALLLQEENGRLILFEAGIGVFFDPKMRARFSVEPAHHALLKNLSELGFQPGDIDVVVLSPAYISTMQVVFSCRGGEDGLMTLAFPNASCVVGRDAWARALNPHSRDRASFIPELQPLIESTGRLQKSSTVKRRILWGNNTDFTILMGTLQASCW